jgi:site-specific recombinase XerD
MTTQYFEQLDRFKKAFPKTDKHIFEEATTQSVSSYRLRCLTKELKIKPISFHGLRHSPASMLLNNGVVIAYVSE